MNAFLRFGTTFTLGFEAKTTIDSFHLRFFELLSQVSFSSMSQTSGDLWLGLGGCLLVEGQVAGGTGVWSVQLSQVESNKAFSNEDSEVSGLWLLELGAIAPQPAIGS
jgi:hypothetical protein